MELEGGRDVVETGAGGTPAPAVRTRLSPAARALVFVALMLGLQLAARVALLLLHRDDSAALDAGDLAYVFLRGLLFDASIVAGLIGLPVFVMTLPFAWARRRVVQQVAGWFCYVAFVVALFMLLADLVYYDYVHRHIGPEVAIATHDLDQNVALVLQQYLHVLAVLVVGAVGGFWLWLRMLRGLPDGPAPRAPLAARLAVPVVSVLVISMLVRGAFPWQERLQVEDAYAGVPPQGAQLVLTGSFTVAHFAARTRDSWSVDGRPWEDALATARDLVIADGETVDDPEYPLARHLAGPAPAHRPNVLVVLLEGWSASDVDVLREAAGKRSLGVTPRFDALSREGVLFTRHYACGQRTRNGVAAVVAGLPSIPGLPYLGEGLEAMNIAYLGNMAAAEGYATYWLQAVQADSQRQDEIARWAGFEHFTSSEDIPRGTAVATTVDTGSRAWDHDMFDEALRQIAGAPRPFLAFVQTSNTHEPYLWPNDDFRKFDEGERASRYRNSMFHADWALGRFLDGAKRDGWLEDTVVVIVSDHTQRRDVGRVDPPSLFHIPCLVLAPGLAPGVADRVCGQPDIIPTIAQLAGWQATYAAVGRSMLDPSRDATRGALCASGELLLRIEDGGWVTRTPHLRVESGLLRPDGDLDAIERRMLSLTQVYPLLMLRDRMLPASPPAQR